MTTPIRLSPAAARWLTLRLPDEILYRFLSSLGEGARDLWKGFKPGRESAGNPVIRLRCEKYLATVPDAAAFLLESPQAPWQSWREALPLFADEWLRRHWRELARLPRGRDFIAALSTDLRFALARRAGRVWARNRYWDPATETAGKSSPELQRLLALLAPVVPAVPPVNAVDSQAVRETAKTEQDLRKRLDKFRGQAEAGDRQHAEEKTGWAEERRRLLQEIKSLREENRNLLEGRSADIAAAVQSYRREVLGLTPELLAALKAGRSDGEAALLQQVDHCLGEQRKLNEKHAALTQVRAEIRKLEAARDRIAQGLAECPLVLPELRALDEQVRERIAQLRSRPGVAAGDGLPELARALLPEIERQPANAHGILKLDEIEHGLDAEPLAALLDPEIRRQLHGAVARRREALLILKHEEELAGKIGLETKAVAQAREIWDLRKQLAVLPSPAPVMLLIDGYNLLKNGPLAELDKTDFTGARRKLIDLVRVKVGRFSAGELVFDGQGTIHTKENAGSLVVVYAARQAEEQNADLYLVARIEQLSRVSAGLQLWLVTADQGLRHRVATQCAAFVNPVDFFHFLS